MDHREIADLSDTNLKWFNFSASPDPHFVRLDMFMRGRHADPLNTRPTERLGCTWRSSGCVTLELFFVNQHDISWMRILFDAASGTAKQTWYEVGPQFAYPAQNETGANPVRQYGHYKNTPGLGSQRLTKHRE